MLEQGIYSLRQRSYSNWGCTVMMVRRARKKKGRKKREKREKSSNCYPGDFFFGGVAYLLESGDIVWPWV
jgi:hypothetical protein